MLYLSFLTVEKIKNCWSILLLKPVPFHIFFHFQSKILWKTTTDIDGVVNVFWHTSCDTKKYNFFFEFCFQQQRNICFFWKLIEIFSKNWNVKNSLSFRLLNVSWSMLLWNVVLTQHALFFGIEIFLNISATWNEIFSLFKNCICLQLFRSCCKTFVYEFYTNLNRKCSFAFEKRKKKGSRIAATICFAKKKN